MVGFGESIDPTAAISSILGTYPFSIGLLREILQNSDDAKASSQVFLLDHRTHNKSHLVHEQLGDAQGPALLAYNNAAFSNEDWVALQRIHQSSKRTDTSKIGKYGVGFRSCYHITDTPQIASGTSLAVLDPHHSFSADGGLRVNFAADPEKYRDHIAAFNFDNLHSSYVPGAPFDGTIIRLPLRQDATMSRISPKTLTTNEIRGLLLDFVNEEMGIVMLFLSHLTTIGIMEVNDKGLWLLGRAEVKRTPLLCSSLNAKYEDVTVLSQKGSSAHCMQTWKIVQVEFPPDVCSDIVSEKLGYDARRMLDEEKLLPIVALAVPTPLKPCTDGRLFTYLPLPLPTQFPCHIHALFALTQARQNLWNCSEKGLVRGTRDQLLVVWNQTLFDTFIPRAWATLLHLLTSPSNNTSASVSDPSVFFHAWPPASQHASGGDPFYWQSVGRNLLRALAESQQAVWPIAGSGRYAPLREVLIGGEEDAEYVAALKAAGVNITIPPVGICGMMEEAGEEYRRLKPESARAVMMEDATPVLVLDPTEKLTVLGYLLSTNDMKMIIGVFVVPLINEDYTALEDTDTSHGRNHVLLKDQEIALFAPFDDDSISFSQLPLSVRDLFLSPALELVNIVPLGCAHVVKCLTALERDSDTTNRVEWLFRFWAWLVSWSSKDEVFPLIGNMPLLPDTEGHLHTLSGAMFRVDGIDALTHTMLSKMGISFLNASFPQAAVKYLETQEVLKSVHSITALLENLRPRMPHGLNQGELVPLRRHIISCLGRPSLSMSATEKSQLRALPIFPVMFPLPVGSSSSQTPQIGAKIQLEALMEGKVVHVVDVATSKLLVQPMQETLLLPSIKDIVFIARTYADSDSLLLVSHISDVRTPVAELDIVKLFIENLPTQPKRSQKTFLECLVTHRQAIPPELLQLLKVKQCIPVGKNKKVLAAPADVVDPKHRISQLFESNEVHLPRIVDSQDEAIIQSLRSLRLLRTTLSDEIVKERLRRISKSPSHKQVATELLHILNATNHSCSDIKEELALCWLPTSNGIRKPSDCRDDSAYCNRALFDRVLDVLDVREFRLTSPSLRTALGWDQDVPLNVVKRQLDAELHGKADIPKLKIIVMELGRRIEELEQSGMVDELREVTSMRQWIPVSSRDLALSSRALLGADRAPPGFHRVHHTFTSEEGVTRFLELMGCSERASNSAILEELHTFSKQSLSRKRLQEVLKLIDALDTSTLTEEDRSELLAPDNDACLRPIHELYYDDLGARAYQFQSPEDRCKAHDSLHPGLVTQLGIQTLSSLNLGHVDLDDDDMQEDLSTRIFNVLRQYSVDQAFNEFLANAADAGANKYHIVVDRRSGGTDHIMSPTMSQFQACPSLVIHNDAVFKEEDFKGIRRIGLGGKQNCSNAIGRFGLGALSMFHFTEMSMIVSGAHVMFLDPSKSYLPPNGHQLRASMRIPLSHIWQNHADHLNTLTGIQGFESGVDFYDGTIFRLPLRSDSQANTSKLSNDGLTAQVMIDLVLAYGNAAPQSLLNIPVGTITASQRDHGGDIVKLWSVKATRRSLRRQECLACTEVKLSVTNGPARRQTETWHIVSEGADIDTLPEEFKALTSKHKLRDISVALAGLSSSGVDSQPKPPVCKLYSKLPLPTNTALPVHMDASFILADDRRSIRFDESGQVNLESRYNCWLLSIKIPSLYTFLLETWPQSRNTHMWPGSTDHQEDPISRMVIESFYATHFARSPRKFCLPLSGKYLSPSESVFLDTESPGVKKIIKTLNPSHFVQLSKRLRMKALIPGVRRVDAAAMHDAILADSAKFRTAFRNEKFSVEDVDSLLKRMLEEAPNSLQGLTILPLVDGSLGSIRSSSESAFFTSQARWEPWSLFPPQRFVHSDVKTRKLVDQDYNICTFTGDHAVSLIGDILPSAPTSTLSQQKQIWVSKFWDQLVSSGIEPASVSSFPLVPTDQSNLYISFEHCQDPTVLAYRPAGDELEWLGPIMKRLGATMITIKDHSAAMQDEVSKIPAVLLDFENILRFLETLSPQWTQKLVEEVDPEDRRRFADFSRSHFRSLQVPDRLRVGGKRKKRIEVLSSVQHKEIARQLPIWETQQGGITLYIAASDPALRMLPSTVPLAAAMPFLEPNATYVEFDDRLRTVLEIEPLTCESLLSSLALPETLGGATGIASFKVLLDVILGLNQNGNVSGLLKVPNSSGTLVPVGTLYAHSDPLFRVAFGAGSEHFLHPALRYAEGRLRTFGLHTIPDLPSFKECAMAVHLRYQDTGDTTGASDVYRCYNDQLWAHVMNDGRKWQELDELRFIPRANIRRNYQNPTFSPVDYVVELPPVVSPDEVLRPEYEAVAWTQRALPQVGPSERLLLANLEFGVPAAEEVIDHLRTLVVISDSHQNQDVLSDLTETYRWLTTHESDSRQLLLEYKDELLFLNVDNPELPWRFASASQIIFNGRDEGHRQCACNFLAPFKKLLLTVGAKEIKQAVRPPLKLSPADQVLGRLRTALNTQRQEQRLTDVELLSSDNESFPAHRAILAAATEHFSIMFGRDWLEHTAPVQTEESADILRHILDYIYVGDIEELDSQEVLLGLLQLSDRWDLPELFKRVENQLIATISLGTYEELLNVGEDYRATALIHACNQFRTDNAHAL